ncbi:MAG: hypothetical protein JXK07_06335 [Spirochaetes bacterium]|nr:hypothetical protein [Spirochaetota bacterium]
MDAEKSLKNKPKEKKYRIAVYFTEEQKNRLDKYAKKLGQPAANSYILNIALMQFLDSQNIH